MLSQTAKPVAAFSDHFMRVFGLRPDYSRLVSDRGYATNVLLTAQRCSDIPLRHAAFELSTLLATDNGKLSTAEDAAQEAAREKQSRARPTLDPNASWAERAVVLMQDTIATYLTPFKAHSLLYRLNRLHSDEDVDRLLGDLQGELMRSVNTESAIQIMAELRQALGSRHKDEPTRRAAAG
jgi:hypothetical protein